MEISLIVIVGMKLFLINVLRRNTKQEVYIYNSIGNLILRKVIPTENIFLGLTELKSGNYIAKILVDKKYILKKFSIVK